MAKLPQNFVCHLLKHIVSCVTLWDHNMTGSQRVRFDGNK